MKQPVQWRGDEPYSVFYDDFYFSPGVGSEAARYIFLQGNDIAGLWKKHARPLIGELGFGAGINFFETLCAWDDRPKGAEFLSFVSFEKHPLERNDFERIFKHFPQYAPYTSCFLAQMPLPLPGIHRLHFPRQRCDLTLVYGDALENMQKVQEWQARALGVHAWYLDGFAPNKNPEMWSQEIFQELYRLSSPGASFATYSASGLVKRNAQAAGFFVEKFPGFQEKRESLRGTKNTGGEAPRRDAHNMRVAVIGAGIAGASCALACARKGAEVALFHDSTEILSGASGNPVALLCPYPGFDGSVLHRFTAAAFQYALGWVALLEQESGISCSEEKSSVQFLSTKRLAQLAATLEASADPHEFFAVQTQASGQKVLHMAHSKQLYPDELRRAFIKVFSSLPVTIHLESPITNMERKNDSWCLNGQDSFDVVILAQSYKIPELSCARLLPLAPVRGQLALVKDNSSSQEDFQANGIFSFDGYLSAPLSTPWKGQRALGATYNHEILTCEIREEENHEMIERAQQWLPAHIRPNAEDILYSRASLRCSTYDRLPFVGALPDWNSLPATHAAWEGTPLVFPKLFCSSGFGSRGFSSAQIAAEILACRICGDPLPLDEHIAQGLEPGRATKWLFNRNAS